MEKCWGRHSLKYVFANDYQSHICDANVFLSTALMSFISMFENEQVELVQISQHIC